MFYMLLMPLRGAFGDRSAESHLELFAHVLVDANALAQVASVSLAKYLQACP